LIVADLTKVEESHKAGLIMARHGFGIQIDADKVSRYCGEWQMDKRSGDGH